MFSRFPTKVVTVSSKGQIAIPAAVRRAHGWKTGTRLSLAVQGDELVVRPVRHRLTNVRFRDEPATPQTSNCRAFQPGVTLEQSLAPLTGEACNGFQVDDTDALDAEMLGPREHRPLRYYWTTWNDYGRLS